MDDTAACKHAGSGQTWPETMHFAPSSIHLVTTIQTGDGSAVSSTGNSQHKNWEETAIQNKQKDWEGPGISLWGMRDSACLCLSPPLRLPVSFGESLLSEVSAGA